MIPFLGAGANLCDRGDEAWTPDSPFLPSGGELADYLASRGRYPDPGDHSLLRVSQYVGAARGEDELYLFLREIFGHDYQPTSLHRLLARSARLLADPGQAATFGGDDELRRPARARARRRRARVRRRLVRGEAQLHRTGASCTGRRARRRRRSRGRTSTQACRSSSSARRSSKPAGCLSREARATTATSSPKQLHRLPLRRRRRRANPIALWQRMSEQQPALPRLLAQRLEPARDPNRIWGTRKLVVKSWAIRREPPDPKVSKIEQTLWDARDNVALVYCELSEYVRELESKLSLPAETQRVG